MSALQATLVTGPASLRSTSRNGPAPFSAARPAVSRATGTANRVACSATPAEEAPGLKRRDVLSGGLALGAALGLGGVTPSQALAGPLVTSDWQKVDLPVEPGVVLLDIGFTETDPNHGFLLGSRQTLLETTDGGKTWKQRPVPSAEEEDFNYRFQSISFSGNEGFIVGKPAILLHTTDGGTNWERIPLSAKLPGNPILITAQSGAKGQAEMTTDQGAIYVTNNAGYSWQAAVQETVDATLNRTVSSGISGASYYEGTFSNIARSRSGDYVAVSSRGNFYLTWQPGQTYWQPHNRPNARRVQNMGWTRDNALWLASRGGDVYFADRPGVAEKFDQVKLGSRGFGILDIAFRDDKVGFACGGSGTLFRTEDGGKSWKRDRSADGIAGNLYEILFTPSGAGFILGNDGILLRYVEK